MANKVILMGNLGKAPEVVSTQEGTKISKFPLATRGYKDNTDWHNIVSFGKVAEVVEKYLKKGSKVYLEGRLQTRSYEDKQGVKKWVTEVIVEQLEFIGGSDQPKKEGGIEKNFQEDLIQELEDDDLPF